MLSELRNRRSFYYLFCTHKQIPPSSSSLHFVRSPSLPHTHTDTRALIPARYKNLLVCILLLPPPKHWRGLLCPTWTPFPITASFSLLHRQTERLISQTPISEQQITSPGADCSASMTQNLPAAFPTFPHLLLHVTRWTVPLYTRSPLCSHTRLYTQGHGLTHTPTLPQWNNWPHFQLVRSALLRRGQHLCRYRWYIPGSRAGCTMQECNLLWYAIPFSPMNKHRNVLGIRKRILPPSFHLSLPLLRSISIEHAGRHQRPNFTEIPWN